MRNRFLLVALLCLLTPAACWASEAADALAGEINAFMGSQAGTLAPATAARAQAFLGAAMLAERNNDGEGANQSLKAAREALQEAERLATTFRSTYRELLTLRGAAHEAVEDPSRLQNADALFDKLVAALEAGRLNEVEDLRVKASGTYRGLILEALPALIEQTGDALSSAARSRAKKYAPISYQRAEAWYVAAKSYVAGESSDVPSHPRAGLKLAKHALDVAVQVKTWRSQADSHEVLLMQAEHDRARIAKALGMPVEDDGTTDLSAAAIVAAIKKQQDEQARREAEHAAEVRRLKSATETQLADLQGRQREEMLRAHEEEMRQLREAFQIKIERERQALETQLESEKRAHAEQLASERKAFASKLEVETKDQKQLKSLQDKFQKGDVDIFPNLDGSVLIRMKTLVFASGSSAVDTKYYDLLGRLKAGLEVYAARKVAIEGHTDNEGDAKANQGLSLKRAEAVRDFLIAAGIKPERLTSMGYGEARPIASNDYEKGRAMNRRIDVIINAPQ